MFSRLDYSDEIVAKTLKNCLKHIIPDAFILLEKKLQKLTKQLFLGAGYGIEK